MADPKDLQGSNADVAAGGLNPEAAFAGLTPAEGKRMSLEGQQNQNREAGAQGSLRAVRQPPAGGKR